VRALLIPLLCLALPGPGRADGSIDLASAVRLAVANSGELAAARLELLTGAARRSAALFSLLPAVSLTYSHSDSVVYDGPDSGLRKILVSVSQRIFGGGAGSRAVTAEDRRLDLARRTLLSLEEETAAEVVRKYADLLAWRARKRTLEEAVDAARFQLSIAREESRLGVATETDALLAALEVKDLELELAEASVKEKRSGFDFGRFLGFRDGETPVPRGRIDLDYRGSVNTGDRDLYLDGARKRSLIMEQLSLRVAESRDALKSARGGRLPEIGLGADFSLTGPAFPLSRPGFGLTLRVGWSSPEFPLSFGLGLGREGRYQRSRSVDAAFGPAPRRGVEGVAVARARLELAARDFTAGAGELGFAVLEELAAVEQLREAAELLREKVRLREKRREILALMVEIGEAPRIDLLREGIEVSQARIGVVGAVMDLFHREAGLLRLCGFSVLSSRATPIVLPEGDA